jgi:hypothetical protein
MFLEVNKMAIQVSIQYHPTGELGDRANCWRAYQSLLGPISTCGWGNNGDIAVASLAQKSGLKVESLEVKLVD